MLIVHDCGGRTCCQAYEIVSQSSHLIVDNILDIGRRSQVVRVTDRSPMAMVNQVG